MFRAKGTADGDGVLQGAVGPVRDGSASWTVGDGGDRWKVCSGSSTSDDS